jgi:hypothetical protein
MDLVEQAAHELGPQRTTDTVHEALRDVIARARRARSLSATSRTRRRSRWRRCAVQPAAPLDRTRRHERLGLVAPARVPPAAPAFDTALVDGELATGDMVRLELLYSARNRQEFAEIREDARGAPRLPDRAGPVAPALWVCEQLSGRDGPHQRSSSIPTC